MVRSGIVQRVKDDEFDSPVPGLGSYMAAWGALPTDRLHEAVMRGSAGELESTMQRCAGAEERAEFLNALDTRMRIPLILAL